MAGNKLIIKSLTKPIRLAVIPFDPLEAYKQKGNASYLQDYYNPSKFADEVYALSPFESEEHYEFGMRIIPTAPHQLKERIRDLKIDLIRAYGGHAACEAACNNKVKGVPVVVSVHDTNPQLLLPAIKNADVVFCMSEAVKKLVQTKFKCSDRIWILPNRVNFDIMRPRRNGDITGFGEYSKFKYKILHIGRKTEQKNLDTLLQALKYLDCSYCVIAIGKNYDNYYIDLAKELGVSSRCFFIDAIPNELLFKYYHMADCMCTPSRWEGFGLVFVEALACETVVVTSNIAPMNEFIHDRYNGVLVNDYENPQAIAQAIAEACNNITLRAEIEKNARESVTQFEKGKVDSHEASYYEKILTLNSEGAFKENVFTRIKRNLFL